MNLKNLTIQKKLYLLVAILTAGLIIYGLIPYFSVNAILIHGPYYNQIILRKDLVADILPPPNYIIEANLTAFQELHEENPEELAALIQWSEKLRKEYMDRHNYWQEHLPEESGLRDLYLVQLHNAAMEFFKLWETQFLPAIKEGKREQAQAILLGPMKEVYRIHRLAVDEVVKIANEQNVNIEAEVTRIYYNSLYLAFGTWILVILVGLLIGYLISKSIIKQLKYLAGGISSVSGQIEEKMNQQSKNIVQQSSSVHETTTTMDELNTSFQHTEALALESSNRTKHALQLSEEGNNVIKQMLDGMTGHKVKVAAIVEQIMKLSELVRQIHNLAAVTSNLTNQTNILALNAAVQAAHVKQHSEGFSVIASEIRKLADESKKFLAHIDVLSGNIQQATNTTITIAEEGNKTMQELIAFAQATMKAFEQIQNIIENTFEGAEQVSLNIKQQATAVHQVLSAMELLNTVSQETVSATDQVRSELNKLNTVSKQIGTVI